MICTYNRSIWFPPNSHQTWFQNSSAPPDPQKAEAWKLTAKGTDTLPKTNMDTQKDCLEKVTP